MDVPQVDLVVFYEPVRERRTPHPAEGAHREGRARQGRNPNDGPNGGRAVPEGGMKRERRMKRLVRRLAQESTKPTESQDIEPRRLPASRQVSSQAVLTDYAADAGGHGKAVEAAKLNKGLLRTSRR